MKLFLAGMCGSTQKSIREQYEAISSGGGQSQLKAAIFSEGKNMKLFQANVSRLETDLKKAESGGLMKAYLAESGGLIFNDANILQSFYYVDDFTEQVILPNCKDFILDSGAFTFMQNAKKSVNWEEYVDRYAEFVKKHNIKKYFELDIDSIVGLEEVERLRNKLETSVGWQCIPVWHLWRGIDYWHMMCRDYNYVAIGGLAGEDKYTKRIKKLHECFPMLIGIAHKNGAKVHGLGFTSLSGLKKYHFDSVDSTSWISGNRYGMIYKFTGDTITTVKRPPNTRVNTSLTAINNFLEWKKFAQYMEKMY